MAGTTSAPHVSLGSGLSGVSHGSAPATHTSAPTSTSGSGTASSIASSISSRVFSSGGSSSHSSHSTPSTKIGPFSIPSLNPMSHSPMHGKGSGPLSTPMAHLNSFRQGIRHPFSSSSPRPSFRARMHNPFSNSWHSRPRFHGPHMPHGRPHQPNAGFNILNLFSAFFPWFFMNFFNNRERNRGGYQGFSFGRGMHNHHPFAPPAYGQPHGHMGFRLNIMIERAKESIKNLCRTFGFYAHNPYARQQEKMANPFVPRPRMFGF